MHEAWGRREWSDSSSGPACLQWGEGLGSSFPENTEETPGFQSFQPQTPSSSGPEGRKIIFLLVSSPEKALEVLGVWGGAAA